MADSQFTRENGIAVEPRGLAAARDEMLRLTRKREIIALATATPSGLPEVAPFRYAVTDDFELVLGTLRTSRRHANLRHNLYFAAVVWDVEFSIQIQGTFDEPVDAEQERLRSFFASEFPLEARRRADWPNHVFFRITPVWARYSDFSDEPPRVLTLDFAAEAETRGTFPVATGG